MIARPETATMGKAHEEGRFKVVIWSNDHTPAHVHVKTTEGEAVIEIESLKIRTVRGMRERDVARAVEIVSRNARKLMTAWRKIHGE
jgi:hypothetical protein